MKKLIIVWITLIASFTTQGQDIFIVVYEGNLSFNSDNKFLSAGFRYTIPVGTEIKYETNCRAIVYSKASYFELKSRDETLNYKTILSKLNNSMSAGFLNYIEKNHKLTSLAPSSKGAVRAGIKGLDDKNAKELAEKGFNAMPMDSALIITGNVYLSWELNSKVAGAKLMVIHSETKDTIYNQAAAQKGSIDIPIQKTGAYHWLIYSKIENSRKVNRVFIKLNENEAKAVLQSLGAFKKEITAMSSELKEVILNDYLLCNKIIED